MEGQPQWSCSQSATEFETETETETVPVKGGPDRQEQVLVFSVRPYARDRAGARGVCDRARAMRPGQGCGGGAP